MNQNKPRRWWSRLIVLVALVCLFLYGFSMTAKPPKNLGITNGRLAECPDSPNCVSTQTNSHSHQMSPIQFSGSAEEAIQKIQQVVEKHFSRASLTENNDFYLRYEFTSLIFRFVDDVEFLIDDNKKLIHFRSASRVGHSDMGANRRRMNKISEELSP